jgi:hypothetical protein
MKPDPSRFLEVAAAHLMLKTGPGIANAYEQSSVMVMGVMFSAVREEFERAAARRVEENAELRRIFVEAAPLVAEADLRRRLQEAASGRDESLAVSQLESGNSALRALLIELHAHVEELDSPEARGVEQVIWRELVASTERRALSIGPF